jgi:hypothetical protein
MTKGPFSWFNRREATDAEKAVDAAATEQPIELDVERLQRSINSQRFVMPSGLTPEQKLEFMLAVADGHR